MAIKSDPAVPITIFRKTRKLSSSSETINDAISDAIKGRPGVKKVELVKIIGKSKPTIERAIALLKQQGRIEYRGGKKEFYYGPIVSRGTL